KNETTIVLTTHYMEEAQALSDKIAVMIKGRLAAFGTLEELEKKTGKKGLEEAFISIVEGM
ncbi:MAG: ABC transporter ATP-binding protein, partial [Lachnospiraceae bacterium]|nr:ABC transporter ATP-binding protein [Lachnospiraceae bacterium]